MSLILDGTNGVSDIDGTAATPAIRGTDANTGIFFPAADTIAFSEGGVEAARFDSAGNLGIGVQNPPVKLHIAKSGGCAFRIDDTSTNYWELRNDSNLIFDRGGTERMRIDSSGRVTTPAQPAFDVGRSGNVTSTADTFVQIVYNLANTNIGNSFNTTNGAFTAPVAGFYQFNVNLFVTKPTGTTRIDIAIYKNGANLRGEEYQGLRTDVTVNTAFDYSFSEYLNANDAVTVYTRCFTNNGTIYGDNYFQRFSGFLVG